MTNYKQEPFFEELKDIFRENILNIKKSQFDEYYDN
jgi:hypothetical protein